MTLTDKHNSTPSWLDPISSILPGLSTAMFYSVPDVVDGRGKRAALKTLALVPAVVSEVATASHHTPPQENATGTLEDDAHPSETLWETLAERPLLSAGIAAGGAAVATGGVVMTEKIIYRWGEWCSSRGVKSAHTKHALILGAAVSLISYGARRLEPVASSLLATQD